MGSLSENFGLYADAFECAPEACVVTDLAGAIQLANAAATRLLRAPVEVLHASALEQFIPMEQRRVFRARLGGLVRGAEYGGAAQAVWCGAVRRDDRDVKVEFSASGIRRSGVPLVALCWLLRPAG